MTSPIRWFDFSKFEEIGRPFGGKNGLLEPVNAWEFVEPYRAKTDMAFLAQLYLSKQNVESLVFYRPETEEEPGVLFTGDSRLAFGESTPRKPFLMPETDPQRAILVTAPHHGSKTNDYAYNIIEGWVKNGQRDVIYIRNGGDKRHPGKVYKKKINRFCVLCPQTPNNSWNKYIHFSTINNNWDMNPKYGIKCSC